MVNLERLSWFSFFGHLLYRPSMRGGNAPPRPGQYQGKPPQGVGCCGSGCWFDPHCSWRPGTLGLLCACNGAREQSLNGLVGEPTLEPVKQSVHLHV